MTATKKKPVGRPSLDKGQSNRLALSVTDKMLKAVDKVAKAEGVSRAEAIRSLVERGLAA